MPNHRFDERGMAHKLHLGFPNPTALIYTMHELSKMKVTFSRRRGRYPCAANVKLLYFVLLQCRILAIVTLAGSTFISYSTGPWLSRPWGDGNAKGGFDGTKTVYEAWYANWKPSPRTIVYLLNAATLR